MKTVEAIQHKDVKGKTLHYILIKNQDKSVLINVGEKTYNSVKQLDTIQPQQINAETEFNPDKEKLKK